VRGSDSGRRTRLEATGNDAGARSRRRPSRHLGSGRRRSGQEAAELGEVINTRSLMSMARGALQWPTCTLGKERLVALA
jgi:hypothetical protein